MDHRNSGFFRMTRKTRLSLYSCHCSNIQREAGCGDTKQAAEECASSILPTRLCNTRAQQGLGCGSSQGRPEARGTLKGVAQGAMQLDRGHRGQVAVGENSHQTRNLPTSARLSPGLGTAGGSRSRDSAWILRNRSLRSVFCARAWNTLKK